MVVPNSLDNVKVKREKGERGGGIGREDRRPKARPATRAAARGRAPSVDLCTPASCDPTVQVPTTSWAFPHIRVEIVSDVSLAVLVVAYHPGPV